MICGWRRMRRSDWRTLCLSTARSGGRSPRRACCFSQAQTTPCEVDSLACGGTKSRASQTGGCRSPSSSSKAGSCNLPTPGCAIPSIATTMSRGSTPTRAGMGRGRTSTPCKSPPWGGRSWPCRKPTCAKPRLALLAKLNSRMNTNHKLEGANTCIEEQWA